MNQLRKRKGGRRKKEEGAIKGLENTGKKDLCMTLEWRQPYKQQKRNSESIKKKKKSLAT